MSAQRLEPTDENLERCAQALAAGGLVAFPTETVYGLGVNANSEVAVDAVFHVKGRPSTDPLIVHVASLDMALSLATLTVEEAVAVCRLAQRFWPGPLTLVVRAAASVSKRVTAGGATVGLRIPGHPLARRLIEQAGVPVAAPSANRFGHVSPTSADHVMADLGAVDVLVLDGGECPVGIESTVLRLESSKRAVVLRPGAITRETLAGALADLGCTVVTRDLHADVAAHGGGPLDAPGQLLTHYAPERPAYLMSIRDADPHSTAHGVQLGNCAILDYAGAALHFARGALHYRDLSPSGNPVEAAAGLFAHLREAERVPGVIAILVPDLSAANDERLYAIHDRLFRATSGRHADVPVDGNMAFLIPGR